MPPYDLKFRYHHDYKLCRLLELAHSGICMLTYCHYRTHHTTCFIQLIDRIHYGLRGFIQHNTLDHQHPWEYRHSCGTTWMLIQFWYIPVFILTSLLIFGCSNSVIAPTTAPIHTTTPNFISAQFPIKQVGESAPDFSIVLLDGTTLQLSDLAGNVVVLNFWASWCTPCRQEMPGFENIWQEYRDQGVVFLGIAVSDEEKTARSFVKEAGVTYPAGIDRADRIAITYRITTMPTTYFIDRNGNASKKLVGAVNEDVLRIFLEGRVREP